MEYICTKAVTINLDSLSFSGVLRQDMPYFQKRICMILLKKKKFSCTTRDSCWQEYNKTICPTYSVIFYGHFQVILEKEALPSAAV